MKTNKKLTDRHFYRFVATCSAWQNKKDISTWTEYEFLGYFAHKLGYNLQPAKDKKPSFHPQLLAMKSIIMNYVGVYDENATRSAKRWKKIPAEWNRQIVKDYLDWHIERLIATGYPAHTPELINNAQNFFLYQAKDNAPVVKKVSTKKEVKLDRHTELPTEVKEIMKPIRDSLGDGCKIDTYDHLRWILIRTDITIPWTELGKHNITQESMKAFI